MTETLTHTIVDHDQWLAARTALLAREKEFTKLRDELSQARRDLPWELVEKDYLFDGPRGRQSLSDLFDGRSQLIVYHFMYPADWDDGCTHCSFWADSFDPVIVHLNARDVTMVVVSISPAEKLAAYQQRMGWTFHWVSSQGSEFNHDLGVSFPPGEEGFYNYRSQTLGIGEREGMSVFFKDEQGRIFHTYSSYARGIDILNTAYNYLDTVPRGRDEALGNQHWVRRHDEYEVV